MITVIKHLFTRLTVVKPRSNGGQDGWIVSTLPPALEFFDDWARYGIQTARRNFRIHMGWEAAPHIHHEIVGGSEIASYRIDGGDDV